MYVGWLDSGVDFLWCLQFLLRLILFMPFVLQSVWSLKCHSVKSYRGGNFCGRYKPSVHLWISRRPVFQESRGICSDKLTKHKTFSSGTMSRKTLIQKNLTHLSNIIVVQNKHYIFIPSVRLAKKDCVRKSVWIRFRREWSLPFQVDCFWSPDVGFSFIFGLIHCVVVCKRVLPQILFNYLREAIQ